MDHTISNITKSQKQQRNPVMFHLKGITNYYEDRISKLVYYLYSRGTTVQEIAEIMGVSKQAINMKYPKEAKK